MKKRIGAFLTAIILCFMMVMPAFAADKQRVVDDAGLLSASEAQSLAKKLDQISEKHQLDVVIVTKPSLEGKSATAYADDYYDANGYGYGNGHDGILFLIGMENRDWAISTTGAGIPDFTDAGQEWIMDEVLPSLKSGDYAGAFDEFAELCDKFITQAEKGKPYDYGNMPKNPFGWPKHIGISLVIAVVISFIMVSVQKGQLKTVVGKVNAANYVRPGSFNLTDHRDIFLYHTVTVTEKPKQSSSGGGGSSTHVGSSGTTHGGSSGRF